MRVSYLYFVIVQIGTRRQIENASYYLPLITNLLFVSRFPDFSFPVIQLTTLYALLGLSME